MANYTRVGFLCKRGKPHFLRLANDYPVHFDFKYLKLGNVCLDVICSVIGLVVDAAADHLSVDSRSVITLPLSPQPSRRASRPSCTCGLREILLLFAVPSGSRWPYRASAIRSCSSALFAAVHGGSLGPSSLSVIFLIALNVKIKTIVFRFLGF